jgi:restriction endonuclease
MKSHVAALKKWQNPYVLQIIKERRSPATTRITKEESIGSGGKT